MENIYNYRNNCTLVALKEITGATDDAIMETVRRNNYRNNDGMYQNDYHNAARQLGIKLGEVKHAYSYMSDQRKAAGQIYGFGTLNMTVKTFLQKMKTGCFLVRTQRHVFVVRDGVLVDTNWNKSSLGRHVVDFTEVLNPFQKAKIGKLKLVRYRNQRKKRAGEIGQAMINFFRTKTNMITTKEELLKSVPGYKSNWLAWDIKRGNIVEI